MIVNRRRITGGIDRYIHFEDPEVVKVLTAAGVIPEGGGITIEEAAVIDLGTLFKNNTLITSFDEFKYFTRPNTTVDFSGCSNLERIDITNCTIIPNFSNCGSLAYFNGPNSIQGVAIIPDGITSITNRWTRCNGVTELHFPDSLNTVGQSVFEFMSNLSKVYFGSGITTIMSNAFYSDRALTEVHISDLDTWLDINFVISKGRMSNPLYFARHLYVGSVEVTSVDFTGRTSVGTNVLSGGAGITSVVLPSTITSIGSYAFEACTNLVIPDLNLPNLTTLGSYAFNGTKVQTISDLGSVTSISEYFRDCSQLTTIEQRVLDKITVINRSAFNLCKNLESAKQSDGTISSVLRLPNLTSIAVDAFRYTKFTEIADLGSITTVTGFSEMTNLTRVVLPQTCTTINDSAFVNDRALTTINLNNITSIDTSAFLNCNNLIYFHGTDSVAGELNLSNVTSIGNQAFSGCNGLTSINIPNTVTSWGQKIFEGCSNLTQVTLTSGLTTLAKYMFQSCTSLTSIVIPNSVTYINEGTFLGCTSLVSVTLPNNITEIPWASFERTAITSLTIPSTVTSIEDRALNAVGNLQTLTIEATTPPTLGGTQSLAGFNKNLVIYVPEGSVSAYQAAWPDFASRIQAIST